MFQLAVGYCRERAGHGIFGNFCPEHAAQLAEYRAEMKASMQETGLYHKRKSGRASTCCTPGCYETRVPPAAYCDDCQAAGAVEEVA